VQDPLTLPRADPGASARWEDPPPARSLGPGEVHVWRAGLESELDRLGPLSATLSLEERVRAARVRCPRARRRSVAARAVLRCLLARYLDAEPAELRLAAGPQGKPFLEGGPDLRFNLSHSGELVLYAFTTGREVGIDVEEIRPGFDHERLAVHVLTAAEQAQLASVPPVRRREEFFACWTVREALGKARGDGLSCPFERVDWAGWALQELDAGPGYAAALVVEAPVAELRRWRWEW
jgi:4'-phosphopantetheinyl transferase